MNSVIYYVFVSISKLIWSFSYVHFLSIQTKTTKATGPRGFDRCLLTHSKREKEQRQKMFIWNFKKCIGFLGVILRKLDWLMTWHLKRKLEMFPLIDTFRCSREEISKCLVNVGKGPKMYQFCFDDSRTRQRSLILLHLKVGWKWKWEGRETRYYLEKSFGGGNFVVKYLDRLLFTNWLLLWSRNFLGMIIFCEF